MEKYIYVKNKVEFPRILNADWAGTGSTQAREDNWVPTRLRSSRYD